MEQFHSLVDYAKNLSLLYVEDDVALQQETKVILDRIFSRVDTALDGQEALEMFECHYYDVVITDLEMPRLNGLQMSKAIKKIKDDVPIVVVSAYSDTTYLVDAIEIGINYYILKPMDLSKLIDTLYNVAKSINEKVLAEEYRKMELVQKVNHANAKLLEELINVSPNPVVVFKKDAIEFMNDAFRKLFNYEELETLLNNEKPLHDMLNEKISVDDVMKDSNEFIEHFSLCCDEQGSPYSKISLKTAHGRKIFLVMKSQINFSGEQSYMYTFNDITVVEYQKVQLNNYSNYMSELTYTKYRLSEEAKSHDIIDKTTF